MRKFILAFLCMILVTLITVSVVSPAQAAEESGVTIIANENYIYEISPMGTVRILRYIGEERNPQIPEKIDGRDVLILGEYSFMGTDILSITLPETLMRVQKEAFYDCQSLRLVNIPEGVTFEEGIFRNCRNLTDVHFDSYVRSLSPAMFYGCISLEKIILPDKIKAIPSETFAFCSKLKEVAFSEELTAIGTRAFYYAPIKISDTTLPNTLTTIDNEAFAYNSEISSLTLPEGVETIGKRAFSYCSNLTTLAIPESVRTIGGKAFANNPKLTTLKAPSLNENLVAAEDAFENTPLEDCNPIPSQSTNTYYFYMPDGWRNTYANTAGIYWWEGTDACSSWPGYEANKTDDDGVYCYNVPKDVTCIIWNNHLDGGSDMSNPLYKASVQTENIACDQYKPGENDNYPDGVESFDNMIYVIDPFKTSIDEYSGKMTYTGEWYYYYGDGLCGFTQKKGDGEIFQIAKLINSPSSMPVETLPTETETNGVESVPCETYPATAPTLTETTPSEPPVPTETAPAETEPNYTTPAESVPCGTFPSETTPSEGESSGTVEKPSTSDPATPDEPEQDYFESVEAIHKNEAYTNLRNNMKLWASLGWDVRIRGDVNGDTVVNVRDATHIQKHLAGIGTEKILLKNADVNTDGSVNIRDATLIQKKVAGIINSFD